MTLHSEMFQPPAEIIFICAALRLESRHREPGMMRRRMKDAYNYPNLNNQRTVATRFLDLALQSFRQERSIMKTKASFAGGPVHPMFVHYPIALWTVSVLADVIFYFYRDLDLVVISKFLIAAGIIGAIASAVPG